MSLVVEAMEVGRFDQLEITITKHLEDCVTCKSEVLELSEIIGVKTDSTMVPTKEDRKVSLTQKRFTFGRSVAAAAVLLLIGSLLFNLSQKRKFEAEIQLIYQEKGHSIGNSKYIGKMDSLRSLITTLESVRTEYEDSLSKLQKEKGKQESLVAVLFQPNEELEEEMSLNLRSGSVHVLQPKINEQVSGSSVIFRWQESKDKFDLVIYNNKGLQVLKMAQFRNGQELKVDKFSFGLYYFLFKQTLKQSMHRKNNSCKQGIAQQLPQRFTSRVGF